MAAKRKIQVKNKNSLVRDSFSKAIINTDRHAYTVARNRKKILKEKDQKILSLEEGLLNLQKEYLKLAKIVESIANK